MGVDNSEGNYSLFFTIIYLILFLVIFLKTYSQHVFLVLILSFFYILYRFYFCIIIKKVHIGSYSC